MNLQVHANPALNHYSLTVYYPQITKLALMRKQDNLKRAFDRFLLNTERVWLAEQGSVDFHFELHFKKNFAVYYRMYANANIQTPADWYTALQIQFPELTRNDDLFEYVCLGLVRQAIHNVYQFSYRDGGGAIGALLDEIEPKLISLSFQQVEDPFWPGKLRLLPYLSLKVPAMRERLTNRQRSIWVHALDTLMEMFIHASVAHTQIRRILDYREDQLAQESVSGNLGLAHMWRSVSQNPAQARGVYWYNKAAEADNFQLDWTGQ